jgi:hypothetical protein
MEPCFGIGSLPKVAALELAVGAIKELAELK